MRWKFSVGMRKPEVSGFRDGRRGDNQQEAGMVMTEWGETGQQKSNQPPKNLGKASKFQARRLVGKTPGSVSSSARLEGIIS